MLALIALFSFFGPYFISHTYDQVFPSYVTIPPSLEPRPDASSLQDVMEGRCRTAPASSCVSLPLTARPSPRPSPPTQPIDPRATRYFDRANEFDDTQVTATEDDGRTLKLTGERPPRIFPVRHRFQRPRPAGPRHARRPDLARRRLSRQPRLARRSASSMARSPAISAVASTMS